MQVKLLILENGVKHIILDGRLDMQGVMEVELKFTAYASSEKAGVIADLSSVPFLASIGIRMLISSAKAVQNRGGKMVLLNPVPLVADVLTTTGISAIIPIFDDLDAACASVLSGMKP